VANIQDVAKKAGVSVATVSRVLNNPIAVTQKTRLKVEQTIKELNYEPSILGRNLRNSESRLLLVLLPNISNPFYTEVINGIEESALEHGYHILLCDTNWSTERRSIYFNFLKNRLADGIISMDPTVSIKDLGELALKYPVVQCNQRSNDPNIPYVTINNELAAYHAVKHLIKLGHQRIALINSTEKLIYARERRNGYERAMKEFNLSINNQFIYTAIDLGFEGGQQAMRKLLSLERIPSAVFAVSDTLAIGALKEINLNGLKVPQDISLIGFDKIAFSNMTFPTLTTVAQPMYQIGFTAASMLINIIHGKIVESMVLDHELVIREST
jgi:LacI family repressor for deo operon, udp, cdd, tsx, nupC, and nupG